MPAQGGIMGMLLPLGLFVVIFYFLIIRPQKKKQKQHEQMLSSISRGDTIVTAGGFFGLVRDVLEDSYILEVDEGVKMRIMKTSISHKRTPEEGTTVFARKNKKGEKPAPEDEKQPEAAEQIETEVKETKEAVVKEAEVVKETGEKA